MQGTDMCFVLVDEGHKRMGAHKEVVSAASKVLNCLLNGSGFLRGRADNTIEIENIGIEAFRQMLFFMYFGTVIFWNGGFVTILNVKATHICYKSVE